MFPMTTQKKNSIVLFIIFGFYIAFAVLEIIVAHTFRMLAALGFLGGLILLTYPLGKWARDFRKLVKSLPADHKYVTQHMAAIDIGNMRFIYHVYEKGNGFNPFSKSYISISVGIPFPPGEEEMIVEDLHKLLMDLNEEGSLTGVNPVQFKEDDTNDTNKLQTTWLGRYFYLEYPLKVMTSTYLVSLQERILKIVDKYHLQDVSWCIMKGSNYGTQYLYYQGNLLQNTVFVKDRFDRRRSDYKESAQLSIIEFEHLFDTDKYRELYQSASRDLGRERLNTDDVLKLAQQMFKGTNKSVAKISNSDDSITIVITIPKQRAASTYCLTRAAERWWIHAQGRLENIDPISVDDESSACDLFLRTISKYTSIENT